MADAATAHQRQVPDGVNSGSEALCIRVPSAKKYVAFMQQRPHQAYGVATQKPQGKPLPSSYFGFTPIRQNARAKLQLNPLHDGPSTYFTAPPAPQTFPWEVSPEEVFGRLTSTLNLKLLRGWARKYLSGPAQSYALNCYTHGFPTRSRAPPLMDIAAPNKVQPGTPAGAAVDEQLARLAERGRLISTDIPLVRGTQTLQYTHASKVKVGPDLKPKIKHRAVVNGDYPNDGTSRKAWVNPGDIAFTVLFTIVEICAFALRFDVVAASLFDYVAFFETLPRALSEIASSATFWRGKFHYSRDHVFGERATPFSANVHATVLQAAQQDWVNRVTVQLHQICRRTDDLMCMHPRADIECAPRAVEAIKLACRAARQPLQDNKEVIIAPRVLFDGLAFDFPEKALGYPAQKQLRLVFLLGRALGVSDATTISRLPSDVRNAAHALLAAHKELASVSDAPQVLRRMELESITSSLEYAVMIRDREPEVENSTHPSLLATSQVGLRAGRSLRRGQSLPQPFLQTLFGRRRHLVPHGQLVRTTARHSAHYRCKWQARVRRARVQLFLLRAPTPCLEPSRSAPSQRPFNSVARARGPLSRSPLCGAHLAQQSPALDNRQ